MQNSISQWTLCTNGRSRRTNNKKGAGILWLEKPAEVRAEGSRRQGAFLKEWLPVPGSEEWQVGSVCLTWRFHVQLDIVASLIIFKWRLQWDPNPGGGWSWHGRPPHRNLHYTAPSPWPERRQVKRPAPRTLVLSFYLSSELAKGGASQRATVRDALGIHT